MSRSILSERKDRGVKEAHFCKKERISPALCDAAHVHCWVVVSGVTYKSNITVIKVKRERERAVNMKNTKLHVGRTRRDITTLAVRMVSRNPYGVSVL